MSVTRETVPCVRAWAASAPKTASLLKTQRTGSSGRGGRSRVSWALVATRSETLRAHLAPRPPRGPAKHPQRHGEFRISNSEFRILTLRCLREGGAARPHSRRMLKPVRTLTRTPDFD